MGVQLKNIGDFLKIDFPMVFRNNFLLTICLFFSIPIIRGISNLNSAQSAQCLAESVSLTGVLMLVPVLGLETESAIKELVSMKTWTYLRTVLLRICCSMTFLTLFIFTFTCVMKLQHCRFPLLEFTSASILYAEFLGFLELLALQITQSRVLGYLASSGYWTLCQLQVLKEESNFYFFPIINGELQRRKILALLILDFLMVFLLILSEK